MTSDWKVGSPIAFHREGKLILQGQILEYDPPRRLSHSFQPMHDAKFSGEQPSRVVYELEQQRDQVKLTVTHDDFAEDSKVFASISKAGRSCFRASRAIWKRAGFVCALVRKAGRGRIVMP